VPSSRPKPWLTLNVEWSYPSEAHLTIDFDLVGDATGMRDTDVLLRVSEALRSYALSGPRVSGPAGDSLGSGGHEITPVSPFDDPVDRPDLSDGQRAHFRRLRGGKGPWLPRR